MRSVGFIVGGIEHLERFPTEKHRAVTGDTSKKCAMRDMDCWVDVKTHLTDILLY